MATAPAGNAASYCVVCEAVFEGLLPDSVKVLVWTTVFPAEIIVLVWYERVCEGAFVIEPVCDLVSVVVLVWDPFDPETVGALVGATVVLFPF